jgi:hypothetical protein
VKDIKKEIAAATATVTISAANPMIAIHPPRRRPAARRKARPNGK